MAAPLVKAVVQGFPRAIACSVGARQVYSGGIRITAVAHLCEYTAANCPTEYSFEKVLFDQSREVTFSPPLELLHFGVYV
ncbi:unnamed protein product [Schistocephalus solidus]|uniref:Uncharacterized protein n=1 Tax=Schistocephalus solidus TaxID=70667 RepID=A0A183T483_SCHSO|nr:unnamed protein product [Schistocephalus solidus]